MAEFMKSEPQGREEDFPLESFLHVEEIICLFRKDAMARASRFANAVTPKEEPVFTTTSEAIGFGLEMAIRNPAPGLLKIIERVADTQVDAS